MPATDAMLTMVPFDSIRAGIAACDSRKVPVRLMSMTVRQSSGSRSVVVPGMAMPATLASTSRRPWRLRAVSTAAAQAPASRTSQITPPGMSVTSHLSTAAPSSASRSATASPMPLAAPDTRATRWSNLPIASNVAGDGVDRYHPHEEGATR